MPNAAHAFPHASKKPLYSQDFRSLGVKDLLDARDQFHVHFAHKPNVFATAIGLYLIRDRDPDDKEAIEPARSGGRSSRAKARTLVNSTVKPWSYPCILVFVTQWQTLEELRSKPEEVVPPFIYMTDGRIVPVCVVLVESGTLPPRTVSAPQVAASCLGIGSPIYVDAQGMRRMGTTASMVSDGSDFYVLTNNHLAGEIGRPVHALLRGVPQLVGTTLGTRNLTEKTFSDIYPELPGRDSVVNIDAAIVRLENVADWNPSALSMPLGPVADFSAQTASLSWIGRPVVAQGAASGEMDGEIKALFYRYKSVGGRDYVADFLIGSRSGSKEPLVTQPGDSGSMWCLDSVLERDTLSPLAMEWGGQRILSGKGQNEFLQLSLATSMAVILRELSLDVIQDPTAERVQYWGPVGHFKIGQQACFLIKNKGLQDFFTANINNLSFSSDAQLKLATGLKASAFVPLSDVPDVVWKTNINRVKPSVARSQENWNHYADIDLPGSDGETLMEKYAANNNSLNYGTWLTFYENVAAPSAATSKTVNNGALPFRVWQIFAKLVDFAKQPDGANFLTAAGCLAHYIGDSCQPLHSSQHSDGLNGASTGVHSTYEDNMVDAYADQIAAGIGNAITTLTFKPRAISTARDAAMAAMDLMQFCQETLPPETICQVYNDARHKPGKSATKDPVLKALWDNCGQATIEVIAAGAVTLGAIWEAAWIASGVSSAPWLNTTYDGTKELMLVYEKQDFLRSLHLKYLGQADLPGSDAPENPPPPPGEKTSATKGRTRPGRKTAKKITSTSKRTAKRTARRA
ncbi:MAG TPA: hypothetical protein VFP59_15680 [Candidatus Angelobacter sp.]|nr:hypothetical protein [Candidatus Angelobacter sp.]